MKHILITGAGSYIGTAFQKALRAFPEDYCVRALSLRGEAWKTEDFSGVDTLVHVAGIAHRKETAENAQEYYFVNRDLVLETAEKAKRDGVKQFVFLSSMSVYGQQTGVITKSTVPQPKSHYGKSKWQAEQGLKALEDENFRVCILRPPMVYGKNCKGNFQTVIRLVRRLPLFPRIENRRSMIYIDHLCAFLKLCVDEDLAGIYLPQNAETVCTADMAALMAKCLGKKLYFSGLFGRMVGLLRPFMSLLQKAFGTLVYEGTEDFDFRYAVTDFAESIRQSL